MKRANGTGTICKLSGTRRRPYAVKITTGYTETGKLQYKYLSYHRTRTEAEKALNRYVEDPYTLSKYTLKELYEEFIQIQEQNKAESTIRNHNAAFAHMKPLWNLKVSDIDRQEIQKFYAKLDATPSIIGNIRRTLKGLIKYAIKLDIMPLSMLNVHNVVDLEPTLPGKKHEHTLITKEERAELWKHTDDDFVRVILFYIYTGLRYSELYELRPEDLYEDHLIIRQAKTEAGKREVPIADFVKKLLPLPQIPCYSIFNESFHDVLPDHKPHDTRHTFVTMLTENNIDQRVIQSIVGHSRKRTVTEIYTHITLDKKLEAVNTLESSEFSKRKKSRKNNA